MAWECKSRARTGRDDPRWTPSRGIGGTRPGNLQRWGRGLVFLAPIEHAKRPVMPRRPAETRPERVRAGRSEGPGSQRGGDRPYGGPDATDRQAQGTGAEPL